MTLHFENHANIEFPFQAAALAGEVAGEVLRSEDWPAEAVISVLITDDEEIAEINRAHRNIDAPTDVLSFPMLSVEPGADISDLLKDPANLDPETGEPVLGDIVISGERAIRQAKEYGHTSRREFAFLIAHSVLHLLGYDHETERDAARMEKKQEAVLLKLGIPRVQETGKKGKKT